MTWVCLSIGSNINAEFNVACCLDALLLHFTDLSLSSVFESIAVGFDGDNFLNMTVGFDTELSLKELSVLLKGIENKQGRDRSVPRFGVRTLDIDILSYGNLSGKHEEIILPRPEITENAYVLWPMSQVARDRIHQPTKKSYKQLWQEFDKESQKLWPVNFEWHGRKISSKQI